MRMQFTLLPYQAEFVSDLTTLELGFCGARGTGKSEVCPPKAFVLAANNVGFAGALCSPTGPMAKKVLIPRIEKYANQLRRDGFLDFRFHKTDRVFEVQFSWADKMTPIYVLAAENVRDSLGLNLAWFGIDEADTMKADVAFEVWRKMKLAMRVGNVRQAFAVSTPEGHGFLYRNWVKDINDSNRHQRRLIRAKTRDNPFLPEGYVDEIMSGMPAHYRAAYLEGEFCNLASGSVYPDFDPVLNRSNMTFERVKELERESGQRIPLHVAIDFNVKNEFSHPYGIACLVCVMLGGNLHVIKQHFGHSRTVDLIADLKASYPGRSIFVYPDASAKGERTSASVSDRVLLNEAGFVDLSPSGNPRIEDRVNALSARICNAKSERRLFVGPECDITAQCIAQQPYDKDGTPEKDTGYDDIPDALGYLVNVHWPVKQAHKLDGELQY